MSLREHGYKFIIKYQLSRWFIILIIDHHFEDNFEDIFAKHLYQNFKPSIN
ncbi:hypothetical protein P700755_002567 [Psychroflexus torquis ATCC 700755]|uniref:Uncharacterized protein n=1 Tax=Psychroflexus torquis (strain ATCC 700755 / CIP 106069 / ACAM 623) TaxID=313595 RepID=K4IV15_PSYTT|nr:hypothetical protein P700755_002567 [Psychroflexus torquis ATCC 700755]